MAKITYDDKVALNENPSIADINKVTDDDMNEIKSVVNANDDEVIAMQEYSALTVTKNDTYVSSFEDNNSYRIGNLVFINLIIQPENITMGTGEYEYLSGLPLPKQGTQFFAGEYTSSGNVVHRFRLTNDGKIMWFYNSQFENTTGWRIVINLVYYAND